MQEKIIENVRNLVPDDGWHIWGFADLTGMLHERFKDFSYGISIGKRLDDAVMDTVVKGPNPPYYELYKKTNDYLADLVKGLSEKLAKLGLKVQPVWPFSSPGLDRSPDYPRTLRHHFSHKMVATRAGLGWIGKTDLLISKKFGARIRLASILVDYPLRQLARPISKSRCGKCNICVEACPAHAASGKLWDTGVDRDEYYDPFKCRDKALELSRPFADSQHEICGICMAVCPVGRKKPLDSR